MFVLGNSKAGIHEHDLTQLTNYLDVSGSASLPVMIPTQRDGHPAPPFPLSGIREPYGGV